MTENQRPTRRSQAGLSQAPEHAADARLSFLPLGVEPRWDAGAPTVCLINPPQTYPHKIAGEFQSYLPVGVASLAGTLERLGADVMVVDALAYAFEERHDAGVTFGLPYHLLKEFLTELQPDIVGITNPFSMFIDDTIQMTRVVKEVDPAIPVIVGGIQASVAPDNARLLATTPSIDILVVGEGEVTLAELVARYRAEPRGFEDLDLVQGILYRDAQGQVRDTAKRAFLDELDALPLPAYHLLEMEQMFTNPSYARFRMPIGRSIPIHASRGCPYKCNFCSVHTQVGYKHRHHSVAYVASHIEHVKQTYGVTHIHIEDDNPTLNPKHTRELLSAIEQVGITWDTPNGTRVDSIRGDVAERMARAGARSITIAVESGVQRILDNVVRKRLDLADVHIGARSLRDAGIATIAYFIIGFPGETETEVRETLRFAKDLTERYNTVNMLFVANPLPGTALAAECRRNGYFVVEPTSEAIFSGIRLNESPLVATRDFCKADLFRWAREELAAPGFVTAGATMPVFWKDSPKGWEMTRRVMPFIDRLVPYPWDRALSWIEGSKRLTGRAGLPMAM